MVSVLFSALVAVWILLQLINKKEFEKRGIERGPLTLIFRSKRGIQAIDGFAKRHAKTLKKIGSLAVWISAPLILIVVASLFLSARHILITPDSPPGVAPLLPEGVVEIEGVPSIPLEYWFIAIVTILIFHEFMHGLLARVEDVPVKSLGIFSITLLPLGAFVEPDDEALEKRDTMAKLRVYAAGSMGNFIAALLSGLVVLSMIFAVAPAAFIDNGVKIQNVTAGSPAEKSGLMEDQSLLGIGDVDITGIGDFQDAVEVLEPGVPITVRTGEGDFTVVPEEREGFRNGYIGIAVMPDLKARPYVANSVGEERAFTLFNVGLEALYWILLLNFLVGMTNLLPIIPLDGGRMFSLFVESAAPNKSREIITLIYLMLLSLVFINAGPLFGLF